MSLEIIFFKKNKYYLVFFVYLLPGFINEMSHNTSVCEESAIEHILRANVWLYGFESVLWQTLTVFCLFVVLFVIAYKI